MDLGAATEPTAATKHQAFSRYLEYDSASRVSMIYSGEAADGKRIQAGLFYDGPGRLIARMSDSAAINTDVSFMSTWDVYTRDALGRVTQSKSSIAPLASPIDLTRVDRVEDSLGRVHSESFWNNPITASPLPGVTVEVKHTWTGADPFRSGLEYSYGASNPANLAMGYTPDLLGRMSTVSWNPTGSSATLATYAYQGSATSKKTIAYSSTVNGITDFAFDQHGRHSKIETLNGLTVLGKVEFFYDAASDLTKEKYVHYAGSGVVREGDRFFYDEHHRLADAWLGADAATFNTEPPPAMPTLVKRVTYGLDAANNRTQVATADANGISTETYATDDDSTPSNRYTTVGPQSYLYDARGNLTFDGRFIYVYDYLNRLSEVWLPVTESESEQMMASSSTSTGQRSVLRPESRRRFVVNNREALFGARRSALARVERGSAAILRMASNPVTARQLSGSIPAGTLSLQSEASAPSSSQAMTDASTIPTRLAPIAFYGYDGFERRTFRLVVASPYIFFYAYDGWQEVSEQITLDGSTATPTHQSVWGRELDELLAIRVNSEFGFTTSYVAEGGAHCPQWLVNSAGATIEQQQYDAYGATSHWVPGSPAAQHPASPQQNPFAWKGHRVDPETGFVQMRHRYYSVVLGRFLSSDPLGVWGDLLSLGNSYCYGAGSPLTISDRLGLQSDGGGKSFLGELFAGIGDAAVEAYNGVVGGLNAAHDGIARTVNLAGQLIWAQDGELAYEAVQDYVDDAAATGGAMVDGVVRDVEKVCDEFWTGDIRGMSRTMASMLAGTTVLRGLRAMSSSGGRLGSKVDNPSSNPSASSVVAASGSGAVAASGAIAAEQSSMWAQMFGALREAAGISRIHGTQIRPHNYSMGRAARHEAQLMGEAWVGPGFRRSSENPFILISKDGLRQYRPPSFKPSLGVEQANFQARPDARMSWTSNGHLVIK